jgi:hypothetical protein
VEGLEDMKYYAVDMENWEWTECETEQEALEVAKETVDYCRECCDPEWPMGVEDIYVLYGIRDEEIDDGFEGCKVLYRSQEVDIVSLTPEEAEQNGCEYYCDYAMRPVA